MKYAGLIFDESFHYLDHLGPFCALMDWPLIVWEDSIADACQTYYPDLQVIQKKMGDLHPPCLVTCVSRPLLEAALSPHHPPVQMMWLPHGLSDKGWKSPFFEALGCEQFLLVYGQKMRDVLYAKNISVPQISVGNFRKVYSEKHRPFYEKLLEQRFGKRRFILYAPTWEDCENNGTFWEAYSQLIQQVPKDRTLLIKLHPNTERLHSPRIEQCKGKAPSNVEFLENFPPIYPLLARTDIYIGDMSSIGYDFLCCQRPMYFLCREKVDPNRDPSAFLMQAGECIELNEISQLFQKNPSPNPTLFPYAFDSVPSNLKERIEACF
ncbi:MAG: CDP-glycerol glycerophosphotransferase family protein [Verrucomicrobiota bacterium]|nr:CDP-glycerol glycerophosphotransferase family protein [Verrucomicrobiota bacterium]